MAVYLPDGSLKTMVDHEMGPFKDGVEIYQEKQAALTTRGGESPEEAAGRSLPWSTFQQRHPDYDAELWEELRALYAGGPRLLRDPKLMERMLPAHRGEDGEVYKERVKRAHYFPYAGSIIDNLVAGLAADPVSLQPEDVEGKDGKEEETELPEWWQEFLEDVSPKGGKRQACQQLLVDQIREALITRCSWTLIDLPQTPEEYVEDAPDSLLAQEKAGLLDPYAIAIEPEYVIDWQDDQNGELEWALICDTELRRDGLADRRRNITKTFTFYDREGWSRYQITYPQEKPPEPDDPVPFLDEGKHAFDKVPLIRMKLPEGLWAMGKLESLAREHFNKRCAQAWAEYKSLFKILYEFMAPEEGTSMRPTSEAQEDPDRGINQVRGQGYSQMRGAEDRAEFIGPDSGPFAEARASCDQIMREMHRVMYSMALAVDTSSNSAIRRSGESKAQDKAATTVILRVLGKFLRDAIRDIVEVVSKIKPELKPRVAGAEKFDSTDVSAAVSEAVELLNGVPIKSATFKKAYLLRIYKTVMGDELTLAELAEIKAELEEQITAEDMMLEAAMALGGGPGGGDDDEDDDEDDDLDEDDDRAAKRKAALGKPVDQPTKNGKPGSRRLFSSGG